jgi:hypothetical protein
MKIKPSSGCTILLLILCSIFSDVILCQNPSDTNTTVAREKRPDQQKGIKTPDDKVNEFLNKENQNKNSSSLPTILPGEINSDPRLDSVKIDAWINYYKYMRHGYRHRANVFTWQLISSIIIFSMVICLVFIGIYFAWLQFKLALKEKEKGKEEDLATEINVSPKEIKVSSPVLGVIILIISLLFFYLYLVYIYPIEELF